MFVLGQRYRRRELHKLYGGQRQGGISTPASHSFIVLFTGESGLQYGYDDDWTPDGVFLYTGEGQRGDMAFVRGNRAIRDHAKDGKDIHLFRQADRGYVRYIGQMVCTGWQDRRGSDVDGHNRRLIVFELVPIDAFSQEPLPEGADSADLDWQARLDSLRERAIAWSRVGGSPSEHKVHTQYRSNAVRVYVLRRADGRCEACKQPAPFRTSAGRLYLEPHHIRRLTDGGPDHPRWVVALCPNCHCRAHYSADRKAFNEKLVGIVGELE